MAMIYHLAFKPDWEAARASQEYRAESLALEGFIHCSKDHSQAVEVANRLFQGRDDMLVLELDTNRLVSPIKHEPSRSGVVYPHIYGPVNTDAVVGELNLIIGEDGRFSGLAPV